MREEAKERQRKITEKMKTQRETFAATNKVDLNSNIDENQIAHQCVLCRESSNMDVDPLCHLVLVQRFGVVSDANITTAIKRVSGVSTNGAFITVRGIGDRYVKTAINGSRIPTLDPFTNKSSLILFVNGSSVGMREPLIAVFT